MKDIKQVAGLLVIIGALNWGLVGLLGLNVVSTLFSAGSVIEKVIYLIIGLSGLYLVYEMYGQPKGKK